jgi:hypothetical protein
MTNPYEPPKATLIPPPRVTVAKSDQLVATRMLLMRENGGLRLGLFLRWSAKSYLFMIIYVGLLMAIFFHLELWPLFTLILGLVAGMLAQQAGMVFAHWKTWPFSLRVTDWEKVERIARGDEV